MTYKFCPFCGNIFFGFYETTITIGTPPHEETHTRCSRCGAMGPSELKEGTAQKRWNKRAKEGGKK